MSEMLRKRSLASTRNTRFGPLLKYQLVEACEYWLRKSPVWPNIESFQFFQRHNNFFNSFGLEVVAVHFLMGALV
jgi:hypothetical protein